MADFLQPHGLQHTRLPCPSLSPRVCSNSCPLSRWCYPIISSFVTTFSSCPQSFPESFPSGWLFASGGQPEYWLEGLMLKLRLQYFGLEIYLVRYQGLIANPALAVLSSPLSRISTFNRSTPSDGDATLGSQSTLHTSLSSVYNAVVLQGWRPGQHHLGSDWLRESEGGAQTPMV